MTNLSIVSYLALLDAGLEPGADIILGQSDPDRSWSSIVLCAVVDLSVAIVQAKHSGAKHNKTFLHHCLKRQDLVKKHIGSVTRWLDYFQHLAIYIHENLPNGKQNLPKLVQSFPK